MIRAPADVPILRDSIHKKLSKQGELKSLARFPKTDTIQNLHFKFRKDDEFWIVSDVNIKIIMLAPAICLCIQAPKHVSVLREEIYLDMLEKNGEAKSLATF